MKTPDFKMTKRDLIEWNYLYNFDTYMKIAGRSQSDLLEPINRNLLYAEVYDLIWDDIFTNNSYDEFILDSDNDTST